MSEYKIQNHKTFRLDDEGQPVPLANFEAYIVKETRTIDGLDNQTTLTIEGTQADPRPPENGVERKPIKLPDVHVDANEFANFAWVLRNWGARAVIYPGGSSKEELRTCIQLNSKPQIEEIYGTMGWQEDAKGNMMYLHAAGAIKSDGNDARVRVVLPSELKRFTLTDGEPGCEPEEAFHASLGLIELGPPEMTWPLWAATFAPILGPCDFAMHVSGRSGTYKSEVTSLFQCHYGASMDARHLPASWSSTANALEAQAHFACNAVMVVDDFVPTGTAYQQKGYQNNADRLIRGQGNQSGRARLSDAASFKSAFYPRGLIISSGEDTPEGQSVRARMHIIEMSPGDISVAELTKCQKRRKQYVVAMAAFIADMCDTQAPDITKQGQLLKPEIQVRVDEIRDLLVSIGHARTPAMLARLMATAEVVLDWAAERGFISREKASKHQEEARQAIMKSGMDQKKHLETADPVMILQNALRTGLVNLKGHLRTLSGGVPTQPDRLGWTMVAQADETPRYKAHGPCIGWIDWTDDTVYFEADSAFTMAKKEAGAELSVTKPTAWKRLKDAGMLKRVDSARSRNTIRVTADGHTRNVVALGAAEFFDTKESVDDGPEEHDEDGE